MIIIDYSSILLQPKHWVLSQSINRIATPIRLGFKIEFKMVPSCSPYTEYEFGVLAVNNVGRGKKSIAALATTGETSGSSYDNSDENDNGIYDEDGDYNDDTITGDSSWRRAKGEQSIKVRLSIFYFCLRGYDLVSFDAIESSMWCTQYISWYIIL